MIESDKFIPFFGVIENVNDPEQLGRVQVRCFGFHTRNKGRIPTSGLPWFQCVISNSSGVSGIGSTPASYVTGSTVFGFMIGDDKTTGIVLGSIMGAPAQGPNSKEGFNDPNGVYPNYKLNESDVNRLARGDSQHWLFSNKEDSNIGSDEPSYANNATYPNNKVIETPSGHIFEVDDTPDAERIHEYHKTGTYYEIQPDGSRVLKVVGDDYQIVIGDKNVRVQGNVNVTIDGNADTHVKGDWNIKVDGNMNTEVGGSSSTKSDGDMSLEGSTIKLNE